MKHTYEWFQQQANANRATVGSWPEWMRSGPAYAAATFPTTRNSSASSASKPQQVQAPVVPAVRKR